MNLNSRNGARTKASLEVRERRQAENDARGARIMTAAARVFARRGVENATMEMIAHEAKGGEMVLTLGAGNVAQLGQQILEELELTTQSTDATKPQRARTI